MSSDWTVGADDLPQAPFKHASHIEAKTWWKKIKECLHIKSSTGRRDKKTKGEKSGQTVTPTQRRHYGLYNQGATCYLNSVLQVLSMTTEIHDRLDPRIEQTDLHLRNIFEGLKEATCGTETITSAFGIQNVNEQRDAAECLEMILHKISPKASEAFQGMLTHTKKCSKGHKVIEERNPFWTLPLSLKDTNDSSYSVERSFERIFQSKSFNGRNKVYCNDCEEKTEAESGCEMVVSPQILTLLLKRFDFDYNTMTHVKSDRCVDVPRELKTKNKKYELYAMVNHIGSLRGGHYTATILSNDDNTWYEFNDSHVYTVKETNSYNSRTVYLLMYREAATAAQRLLSYFNPGNWSPFNAAQRLLSYFNLLNGSPFNAAPAAQRRGWCSYVWSSLIWLFLKAATAAQRLRSYINPGNWSPFNAGHAAQRRRWWSYVWSSLIWFLVKCPKPDERTEREKREAEEKSQIRQMEEDASHSIKQENTNSKFGELKQTEVDYAPVRILHDPAREHTGSNEQSDIFWFV